MAAQGGIAQKKPSVPTPEDTRKVLVEKAHALENRGRPDMAIQLWQQVLLSDPGNAEALAGLAKDYKISGLTDKASDTLEKMRRLNPNDPNIGKIAEMTSTRAQSEKLRQAGELSRQGKSEAAMSIYRELFGNRPPDGDIALAYYQTLYGTNGGKAEAIQAMRSLAQRNPGDSRFVVELGIMLTYEASTRAEGIRILQAHPREPNADEALRQALIWDAANPATAAELRQYLKNHPQDQEIAGHLKQDEAKLAQMNSGIARTPEERKAFAALNAHRLDEAETRFQTILSTEPDNGRVQAGMGFLRMQQNNFAGAISFLSQAEQDGYKSRVVENALATSRFWYTMGEATQALEDGQADVAMERYKAALAQHPNSPEALNGVAGLYVKQQQFQSAAGVYQQLIKLQPGAASNWRGLFLSYAQDGQIQLALTTSARFPAAVKAALSKDPEYLRVLASAYQATNRSEEARRTLAQALALPFPENGANLKSDTRLQYAGILMEARRFDQAAGLYEQILNEDAGNLSAWMGLVSAHHELSQDTQSIADVQKMPPATYEAALGDPGFLAMLGAIYQQANQFEVAQGLLERSVKLQLAAGGQPSIPLQLQLAAIYLQRNLTTQAYDIYRQILAVHPDRVDAWKGLIATLQVTNRTAQALQEIAQIPPAVRKQLENDIEFVQSEASMYAASGDIGRATEYMNRVEAHYNATKELPPANIEVQNAWLLYNTKNDRLLFSALMRLGSRKDLTIAQRETVQTIWASWSVRRAGIAMDNGNPQRAVEILEAAAMAFPDNLSVRKAVAGGYVQVGRARDALALFKSVPMQDASAGDFRGAVGAALAANDKAQAEIWLRQALDRFPRDAGILQLAARFEQARGDNQRAEDYYRAALAAMPQASPVDRLAHDLVAPEQDTKVHRAATPADLQRLLDPNNEPFPKTTKLPPLPAYGADPYGGSAPVVLPQPQQASQPSQNQWIAAPASAGLPVPAQSDPLSLPAAGARTTVSNPGGAGSYSSPNFMGTMHLPAAEREIPAPLTAPSSTSRSPVQDKPVYIPPVSLQLVRPATQPGRIQPGFVEQSATGDGQYSTANNSTGAVRSALPSPMDEDQTQREISNQSDQPRQAPLWTSASTLPGREPRAGAGLRISAQPMDQMAARAQALFAEQTDAQVTQGSAANLHLLPIARQTASEPRRPTIPYGQATGQLDVAQYTPSVEDATSGAYSAQKPQQATLPQPSSLPQAQHPLAPETTQPQKKKAGTPMTKPSHPARRAAQTGSAPTLGQAPAEQTQQPVQQTYQQPSPQTETQAQTELPQTPSPSTSTGLTDDELQERNLPPLRGPWVRIQREKRPLSPRDEAEAALTSIESGYSGWLGGAGVINYRSGDLGFDHLSALEAPYEVAMPLGYAGRFVIVARPVFLDSGQADGNSVITVQQQTTGGTTLVTIPQPIGTLTASNTTPPAQQNAVGIGGEAQLIFKQFAIAGGYTPYNFLVATPTGRLFWKPGNGPISFSVSRDSVKDTQLSYAGLRDPSGNTLGNQGQIWGGVVADQGNVQFTHGDAQSGFYLSAGGQYLSGYKVETNTRVDGSGGAYWRLLTLPEYGNLSIGANFFGMHYEHDEDAFTHGMGGYFSPQAYFLANAPFTWNGHSGTTWHYNIMGSLGVQAFQNDLTSLWPLAVDKALLTAMNNASLPAKTSVGPNYDLRSQLAYQVSPHWFVGGFLSANNSRNYSSVSAGFTIRFLFRSQPSTVAGPTGLFPTDGIRPFSVP
jgi:tetratricopeptide (TPR) repeat protein